MKKLVLLLAFITVLNVDAFCPSLDFANDSFFTTFQIIIKACQQIGYDEQRALAMFSTESDFKNVTTFSKKTGRHYYGIGQICLSTARSSPLNYKGAEKDLEKLEISIPLCIKYMKYLDKRFKGDYEKVMAHYSGYVGHKNREKHYKKVMMVYNLLEGCSDEPCSL